MKSLIPLFLAAAFACSTFAQERGRDSRSPTATVSLDGIDILDAGSDHVQLSVRTHATANRDVRVRAIGFEQFTVNQVPVYLEPLSGPFDLRLNVPFPLPPIPVNIFFRDLSSLGPIEQAVDTGEVQLHGQVRVAFDLSLLDKLLLQRWSGRTDLRVDQAIPVAVPGGIIGRVGLSASLHAADLALGVADSALGQLRRSQEDWTARLGRQYAPALVLAESRYSVITDSGSRLDIVRNGVGFRTSGNRFLLTGEMVTPWTYDPQVATLLQSNRARLIPESEELLVWPGNVPVDEASARSFTRGDIRLAQSRGDEESLLMPEGGRYGRVRLSRRDSARNVAVLEFTHEDNSPSVNIAPEDEIGRDGWERVAVFRYNQPKPELIFLTAHREGRRLILDTPIDDLAFGSPVVTPAGVVAILQDERSGALMDNIRY